MVQADSGGRCGVQTTEISIDMIQDDARSTYVNILAEIKRRISAIDDVLDRKIPIAAKIGEELCILQCRMIAELIAIGCLVLHNDLTLSNEGTLAKSWNAGQIFKRLSRLHDDFYPQPLKPTDEIGDKFKWESLEKPYMTKDRLISLYEKDFGSALHRGSFRKIFKDDPPLDFPRVSEWRQGFVDLLNRHTVISCDRQYICHFNMSPVGESPTGYLFQRLNEGSNA